MKSAQEAARKFVERASAATQDYADGVSQTDKSWSTAAAAAADIHKQATIEALNRGAYAKGVREAGDSAWERGVQEKGVNRYSEGVATSSEKYARNSGEYDSARSAADNLPRGPKGSEINMRRVDAVVKALRAKKVGN